MDNQQAMAIGIAMVFAVVLAVIAGTQHSKYKFVERQVVKVGACVQPTYSDPECAVLLDDGSRKTVRRLVMVGDFVSVRVLK